MEHDTNHEEENKPVLVTKSAVAFGFLIVGGLIAAINFVQVMGHSEDGHGVAHEAHATNPTHEPSKTAPAAHNMKEPMTNTPKDASSSSIEDPKTTDSTAVGH